MMRTILIAAAAAALAFAAQAGHADDLCSGLTEALAQPHGFDAYKGTLIGEDKKLGFTNWQSRAMLADAASCEIMYDVEDKGTTYICDFVRPPATPMSGYQAAMAERVAACLRGAHAFHYDAGQKRIDYVEATAGTVILSDNTTDHQTLTLLVQQADIS